MIDQCSKGKCSSVILISFSVFQYVMRQETRQMATSCYGNVPVQARGESLSRYLDAKLAALLPFWESGRIPE